MPDETIPLYDGELSGATIVHEAGPRAADCRDSTAQRRPRRKRRGARTACERVHVCFSAIDATGRTDHTECPVIDVSKGGFCLEFDRPLASGVRVNIAYYTVSHRPVNVSGQVRHCRAMPNGRYRLGLELCRHLDAEEMKPSKTMPARDIAPGFHPRKLS